MLEMLLKKLISWLKDLFTKPTPLPEPWIDIKVCNKSARLAGEYCEMYYTVTIHPDELADYPLCDMCTPQEQEYVTLQVCGKTHRLPTPWCPKLVMKTFKKGEEPKKFCNIHKEKVTQTKYPFHDWDYAFGYVPWDAHALNLPFTEKFTWQNWKEGVELMARHNVNFVRFFFASSEDQGFPYILPFKKQGGKYDLLDTTCTGYDEIHKRLTEFWKRGITTLICLASGVKDIHGRFDNCVWNGKNNTNGTTLEAKDFMKHAKTKEVMMGLIRHLDKDRGWKNHPVIYEIINEHNASPSTMYNFYRDVFIYCESLGIPFYKFAFEFWDSGKVQDLLDDFDCVCPRHGYNHVDAVRRAHIGEMQNVYFNDYSFTMLDSDGQVGADYAKQGVGLVGLKWNKLFRRFAPAHIQPSFKLDEEKMGGGIIVWSAGAYYKNRNGNEPDYREWKKVAIDGLNTTQLKAWQARYEKENGIKLEVDYALFKTKTGEPLGELKAIKRASNALFE